MFICSCAQGFYFWYFFFHWVFCVLIFILYFVFVKREKELNSMVWVCRILEDLEEAKVYDENMATHKEKHLFGGWITVHRFNPLPSLCNRAACRQTWYWVSSWKTYVFHIKGSVLLSYWEWIYIFSKPASRVID